MHCKQPEYRHRYKDTLLVLFVSTVLIIILLESKNLSEIQSLDMFRQISTLLVAFPAFSFSQLPTLGPTLWIHMAQNITFESLI